MPLQPSHPQCEFLGAWDSKFCHVYSMNSCISTKRNTTDGKGVLCSQICLTVTHMKDVFLLFSDFHYVITVLMIIKSYDQATLYLADWIITCKDFNHQLRRHACTISKGWESKSYNYAYVLVQLYKAPIFPFSILESLYTFSDITHLFQVCCSAYSGQQPYWTVHSAWPNV